MNLTIHKTFDDQSLTPYIFIAPKLCRNETLQKSAHFILIALFKMLFDFGKKIFGIGDLFRHRTPKSFRYAALDDHKTHSVRTVSLLIDLPIIRGTSIRMRSRLIHSKQ